MRGFSQAGAPVLVPTECDTTPIPFASLGLDSRLLEGVRDLGFAATMLALMVYMFLGLSAGGVGYGLLAHQAGTVERPVAEEVEHLGGEGHAAINH